MFAFFAQCWFMFFFSSPVILRSLSVELLPNQSSPFLHLFPVRCACLCWTELAEMGKVRWFSHICQDHSEASASSLVALQSLQAWYHLQNEKCGLRSIITLIRVSVAGQTFCRTAVNTSFSFGRKQLIMTLWIKFSKHFCNHFTDFSSRPCVPSLLEGMEGWVKYSVSTRYIIATASPLAIRVAALPPNVAWFLFFFQFWRASRSPGWERQMKVNRGNLCFDQYIAPNI